MADETLTVAERVAKHFPEWLKVRDQVYDKDGDLIVPTDDNTVVIQRYKLFRNLIKEYKKSVMVRVWVECFERHLKSSGLSNNPRLILNVLLEKASIETALGRQVHEKCASLESRSLQARVDAGAAPAEANEAAFADPALREYIVVLLKYIVTARANKANLERLNDKWDEIKLKSTETIQTYFYRVTQMAHKIAMEGGVRSKSQCVDTVIKGLGVIYSNSKDHKGSKLQYDVGATMRKWWAENRNVTHVKEEPMQALQDELTSYAGIYKLKVKISDDASDEEDSDSDDATDLLEEDGKKKKKVRFASGKGDKNEKPKEKLSKAAKKIPTEDHESVPCALCVARGRKKYAGGHSMLTCFDYPEGDYFEPVFGYDADGNKKGTDAAKRAWEKRKKTLPGYTERKKNKGGGGGSSGSGKRSYSEAELETLLDKKVKKLKADKEKADTDFATRMQEYEKAKGYVSVASDELAKLRRARTVGGHDADTDDKAQWKFNPVTGDPM